MSVALLQPFVPGIPMSASLLVGRDAQTWLIGIGIQRVVIRKERFEYQGGSLPASSREAESQVRMAVESIPGLRGFVGVDFIWDPERGHATIMEVNPRPTTSCVGLTRLLPSGLLAEAWLNAFDPEPGAGALLSSLAELVHGAKSLSFDARGDVIPDDRGIRRRGGDIDVAIEAQDDVRPEEVGVVV
jgi:hypothetical protein